MRKQGTAGKIKHVTSTVLQKLEIEDLKVAGAEARLRLHKAWDH